MDLQIRTDQHQFVSGKTRYGKSMLVKSFLFMYPRVIFHDRKHEHWDLVQHYHFALCSDPLELTTAIQHGKHRILYMPRSAEVEDFDEVCSIVFQTGNACFVIDEAASYCPSNKVPYWTGELYRLGSQLGIGVIGITQRPREIYNILLSESTNIISFRLALDTDRSKIVQVCGKTIPNISLADWRAATGKQVEYKENPTMPVTIDEVLRTLPKYHFMVYNAESDNIAICAPLVLKR